MRSRYRLGAFYFFSRDTPQRTPETLIRTLAYQLAIFDARFGAIEDNLWRRLPNPEDRHFTLRSDRERIQSSARRHLLSVGTLSQEVMHSLTMMKA